MQATLYLPQHQPAAVSTDGLALPDAATGFARVPDRVPGLLGCAPELVDVLASGPDFVAYSVFDYEGPTNHTAMAAVAEVSGVQFDPDAEDERLCGPVLVITSH